MSPRRNERYFIMNANRYSLLLKEILLLLPVRLYSVLRQKLHEFQRLFDFYQNLINFTAFDLLETKRKKKMAVSTQLRLTQNNVLKQMPERVKKALTGKQKTSSSVDLLFLMVDIWMPWETWRKAAERRVKSEHHWSTC